MERLLQALILAIIEGITEFLPVSSTGHMMIASAFMGIHKDPIIKNFEVIIQFGAILSVVVLYWKSFFQSINFYVKLFVAFLPAAVIGFLADDLIDSLLSNVYVVVATLFLGGIVLLFVDKWFHKATTAPDVEPTMGQGLKIGFFQCIAMIPGVSRSAASIIGGMATGLSRKRAAEFSFFLAVPTMFGAASLKVVKSLDTIKQEDIFLYLFGSVVAFLVAMIAIKTFIKFIQKNGFKVFGWYRIILAVVILLASFFFELSLD
jgi:undecaprenyl-diphosphatase